ncbi:MAG: hypothetical protein K0Q47_58 [Sedimentibacter sp.]|jgi:Zn finger protein HypA/HybF involved in hydrogenase expression|nr:hypothetical protein [Sedimentibacter sp.]
MTNKEIYAERLADGMRSAGQENWSKNDIQDLCELAGMWDEWLKAETTEQEQELAIKAAKKLNVKIRHYVLICNKCKKELSNNDKVFSAVGVHLCEKCNSESNSRVSLDMILSKIEKGTI